MTKIPPKIFLKGIRNRDATVIRAVMDECFPLIHDYVLKNKGNEQDAEDLIAEAFIVIFQKTKDPEFSIDCAIPTYIYAICKNLWLKQLRKKKRQKKESIPEEKPLFLGDDIFQIIEKNEKAKLYQEKIQLLNKTSKYILFLFYREKKSYKEIAQIMELKSAGYAKKLKFLAQQKLIELVKSDPRYEELKY